MTDSEISLMIDAYLDGTLTKSEGEALNRWVKASPEHARTFARATWLHRQVYDAIHVRDLQQLNAGVDDADPEDILAQLRALEDGSGQEVLINLTPELERREAERKRARRRAMAARAQDGDAHATAKVLVIPRLVIYAVAAVVALGLLTALYSGLLSGPRQADPVAQNDPAGTPDNLPPVVAELVGGNQPVWADASLSARPGSPLRQGLIELTSGTAEVRFRGGAAAVFRAPAIIDLRGDNRMALIQGAMVANVPDRAYGFTVDTPSMRVVDMGTEFGITADAMGNSAVQVFVGEVNAAAYDASGQLGSTASIRSRHGLEVDGTSFQARPIKADGEAFEDLAPHLGLLYRNLVVNGDFEQGDPGRVTGQAYNEAENIRIPGWEDHGPGTVLSYDEAAAHDYPDPARHVVPEDRGRCYYLGMAAGKISQRIDVYALRNLIDGGAVRYDLSAWLGGFETNDEYLLLSVRFLDGRGQPVSVPATLTPVRASDRRQVSAFLQRDRQGGLPAGTRWIEIELDNIGENNPPFVRDGYADNVAIELWVD